MTECGSRRVAGILCVVRVAVFFCNVQRDLFPLQRSTVGRYFLCVAGTHLYSAPALGADVIDCCVCDVYVGYTTCSAAAVNAGGLQRGPDCTMFHVLGTVVDRFLSENIYREL